MAFIKRYSTINKGGIVFWGNTLGAVATHVSCSVFVNGISYPGYDIIAGFSLPDLDPVQNNTVSYTVIADNPKTESIVNNFGTIQYSVNDPISGPRSLTENTNTIFAVVSTRLTVQKSVDKTYALTR